MISVKSFFIILFLSFSIFSFSQNKIDLLLLNKDYKEALTEIDIQIVKNPSAQLYYKEGLIYNNLQNYQSALNSFTTALQLDPNNSQIIGEIAEGLSIIGNQYDAVEFFKRAIELEPDNLTLKGKLGRVFINQKKIKLAYDVFAEIYTIDSTNIYWNKQLAFCSFRVGERLRAISLYENVLEVNPRDYGTYLNLIHSYSRKKEPEQIIATIDKGLVQFPRNTEFLLERANFYFKTKNYELAMSEFENYFSADGDSIYEIILNFAISTYFSKKTTRALDIFGDLFRANPNDPFVQFYMSLCNKRLKNFEEAEKMMNWAIEMSIPEYVSDMYHHLGQIYGQQRMFKESIEALQKSYEIKPNNHEVLFEIATTYEEFNSNKTLALNYYRIYLENVGDGAKNVNYALDRITKLKEDLFFE